MLVLAQDSGTPDCRIAVVAPCELDGDPSQSAPIPALDTFQMKIRDTTDFRVDFSQWLAANGNPILTAATFTVADDSPSTPEIIGQAFVPAGKCVIVIAAADGAKAGDAFWLDITVHVGVAAAVLPTDVAIPARVLTRRINVVLVNG